MAGLGSRRRRHTNLLMLASDGTPKKLPRGVLCIPTLLLHLTIHISLATF